MSFASANIVLKNNRKLLVSSRSSKRNLMKNFGSSRSNGSKLLKEVLVNKPWVNRRIANNIQRRNFNSTLSTILVFLFLATMLGIAIYYMVAW